MTLSCTTVQHIDLSNSSAWWLGPAWFPSRNGLWYYGGSKRWNLSDQRRRVLRVGSLPRPCSASSTRMFYSHHISSKLRWLLLSAVSQWMN